MIIFIQISVFDSVSSVSEIIREDLNLREKLNKVDFFVDFLYIGKLKMLILLAGWDDGNLIGFDVGKEY